MQDHCSVTFTLDADEIEYDENIFLSLISSRCMHGQGGIKYYRLLLELSWKK